MRLIDADALEKTGIPFAAHGGATFIALGSVRTAPTIEAEPVWHGRWTCDDDDGFDETDWHCSECGGLIGYRCGNPVFSKRCPNCGAKMDKEAE